MPKHPNPLELAREIATALGWTIEDDEKERDGKARFNLKKDGSSLQLRFNEFFAPDHVIVCSEVDHFHHAIRVAHSRGAAIISKEINRRFMPGLQHIYSELDRKNKAMEARVAAKKSHITTMVEKLGRVGTSNVQDFSFTTGLQNGVTVLTHISGGFAEDGSDITAEIKLMYVPIPVAMKIMELLGPEKA